MQGLAPRTKNRVNHPTGWTKGMAETPSAKEVGVHRRSEEFISYHFMLKDMSRMT